MARTGTFPTVLALLLLGCASGGGKAYVAATYDTVLYDVETAQGEVMSQTIFLHNRSTVPVRVYGLRLSSCRNVVLRCDVPIPLDIRVEPGARVRLQRIEPQNRRETFNYRYSPQWRAESGSTAALSALAENGSEEARNRLVVIQRAEAQRREDLAAGLDRLGVAEVNALGTRVAGIVAEPDSIVVSAGELFRLDDIRLIVVGQGGERLGRFQGFRFRVHGGVTFTPPDSLRAVTPGRTLLELMLPAAALPDRPTPVAPASVTVVIVRK